jgi:hypothetical protein
MSCRAAQCPNNARFRQNLSVNLDQIINVKEVREISTSHFISHGGLRRQNLHGNLYSARIFLVAKIFTLRAPP